MRRATLSFGAEVSRVVRQYAFRVPPEHVTLLLAVAAHPALASRFTSSRRDAELLLAAATLVHVAFAWASIPPLFRTSKKDKRAIAAVDTHVRGILVRGDMAVVACQVQLLSQLEAPLAQQVAERLQEIRLRREEVDRRRPLARPRKLKREPNPAAKVVARLKAVRSMAEQLGWQDVCERLAREIELTTKRAGEAAALEEGSHE